MPDIRIVCLANSRKQSGRCVAGLRTDGGGWIRPVSAEGPLTRRHYMLDNNTEAMVLDIIDVNLRNHVPKPYQPENWLIGRLPWRLVARPAPPKYIALIRQSIENGPELFGNTLDRVPLKSITQEPVTTSFALVIPKNLEWHITASIRGSRQIRARFTLSGCQYSLVVTDPRWEHHFIPFNEGFYSSKQVSIENDERLLFTISLGGPFRGECYKLIAAIIIL